MENFKEMEDIVSRINNGEFYPKYQKAKVTKGIGNINEIQSAMNYQLPQNQMIQYLNANVNFNCPICFHERWLPITKKSVPRIIEGMYYISDRGRVVSDARCRKGITILTPTETNNGYLRVNLRHDDGTSLYYSIHRIEKIEFDPVENFENLQVNHFDGNKHNNWLSNLQWTTGSENINHAYRNGLKFAKHGEDCSFATITNAQADQIGYLLAQNKYSHEQIAQIVKCKTNIVTSISCGSTWKDVYRKYQLEKFKKRYVIRFSDEQLHLLFKYFEDHKQIKYRYNSDLFKNALKELFNINYANNMSATMSRLLNRQTRTDISDQYDY